MPSSPRHLVKKTYKLYINGAFPRSESGRTLTLLNKKGACLAHYSHASVKDLRDAVVAARSGWKAWDQSTPFLRSQILYRAAEMLEGRSAQFQEELTAEGLTKATAARQVSESVDTLVQYAGWCDKHSQIFSSINPVSSPHYNFTASESCGVIGCIPPERGGMLGLVSSLGALLSGGNSVVALAPEQHPLSTITLAEVFHSSDLPPGVLNLLTSKREELLDPLSQHMDVNAILICTDDLNERQLVESNSSLNVKRVVVKPDQAPVVDPYLIDQFQEKKTTWHPVGC